MDFVVMKRVILSVCVLAAGLGLMSCEKHDWEKTKKLYEHADHDDHAEHGDHDGHGHDEAEKGE